MQTQISDAVLELVEGDITKLDTDAIVNAANERLAHGGGVAAIIARRGGPVIQKESNEWVRKHGRVPAGSAAITSGGDLKADYVIHAVGPRWGEGQEQAKLRQAVLASLELADRQGLKTIALPAISTGIFGFPLDLAAETILKSIQNYLAGDTGIQIVILTLFDEKSVSAFRTKLEDLPSL